MANIAVYVDLHATRAAPDGDFPGPAAGAELPMVTGATHYALESAREIAHCLGATVYALVATGPLALPALEHLARVLGRAGADRVLVCSDPALSDLPIHATHGPVLSMVAQKISPRLFFFPAGAASAQLAAPLAAELQAMFFPGATVSATKDQFLLARARPDWNSRRVVDGLAVGRAMVVAMASGRPRASGATGTGPADAELEILSFPTIEGPVARTTSLPADPADDGGERAPVPWEEVHTMILAGDRHGAVGAAPPGVWVVADDGYRIPADVLCPTTLALVGSSVAWPPAVLPAADAAVLVCTPKKLPSRGSGITMTWKAEPEAALPAIVGALANDPRGRP